MSSMIFKFDESSSLWDPTSFDYNKLTFGTVSTALKKLYHDRYEQRDVLELTEILRAFGIKPEPIHYGLFVLGNRFSDEEPDFIKQLVCQKDMIIFEVTDIRRD